MYIELVRFRARPGVGSEEVLSAANEVNIFLSGQAGFVRRHLGVTEDGTWHDILFWRSREDLELAMPKAPGSPHCRRYFGLIEPGNDVMYLFPDDLGA